jgi:hypothetical protein
MESITRSSIKGLASVEKNFRNGPSFSLEGSGGGGEAGFQYERKMIVFWIYPSLDQNPWNCNRSDMIGSFSLLLLLLTTV